VVRKPELKKKECNYSLTKSNSGQFWLEFFCGFLLGTHPSPCLAGGLLKGELI
jgi:hypothetical protein